jgi:hypothetical protein
MKKSFLVTLSLVAMIAVSLAFTNDQDRLYKNLKVLPKNITKTQMDSVMKSFTVALGVKCNFCHMKVEGTDTWDFPSDANKHKLIARDMMKMTTKINKKYFDYGGDVEDLNAKLNVTCFSCHNGKKEPLRIPAADSSRRK